MLPTSFIPPGRAHPAPGCPVANRLGSTDSERSYPPRNRRNSGIVGWREMAIASAESLDESRDSGGRRGDGRSAEAAEDDEVLAGVWFDRDRPAMDFAPEQGDVPVGVAWKPAVECDVGRDRAVVVDGAGFQTDPERAGDFGEIVPEVGGDGVAGRKGKRRGQLGVLSAAARGGTLAAGPTTSAMLRPGFPCGRSPGRRSGYAVAWPSRRPGCAGSARRLRNRRRCGRYRVCHEERPMGADRRHLRPRRRRRALRQRTRPLHQRARLHRLDPPRHPRARLTLARAGSRRRGRCRAGSGTRARSPCPRTPAPARRANCPLRTTTG